MTRPFAVYPDSFDGNTLGLWRFGERGGLLTDIVAGKVLTNFGAEPLDEGYRFVAGDPDHMTAAFAGQGARSLLTLECWIRAWGVADGVSGFLFDWHTAGTDRAFVFAVGGAAAFIEFRWRAQSTNYSAIWADAAAVQAILASPDPWHLAVTVDVTGTVSRLFINGIQRAVAAPDKTLIAGDYTLYLGCSSTGAGAVSAVIDEVRISGVARYAADFPIARFQDGQRAVLRGPGMRAGVCAGVIQ